MDVIGAIGPGSTALANNFLEGYQPVSRNGEVTQNAFIDAMCWNKIMSHKNKPQNDQDAAHPMQNEDKPRFSEWASVQPGFLCVYDKGRSNKYRNHTEAETAVPVIACAQLMDSMNDKDFAFAGVTRSKSVRDDDDVANGVKRDDFFTLAIGGPATILNNGNKEIKMGDMVEWTFYDASSGNTGNQKRQRVGPRRIQVRTATKTHARVFGRALSYAKRGESFDVLIGSASM